MSTRELVVLGTASQVPTRERNHNGYLLRWDGEGFLFDPGEGTQRQLTRAGVAVSDVTRLFITHFHGDHCLGVPGVVQRLSLDQVAHTVVAHYPATGAEFFARLRYASAFHDSAPIVPAPVAADGVVATGPFGSLSALRLDHPIETYGYRLVEPDGRRMLPDRLASHGISGPDVGRLVREGAIAAPGGDDRVVTVEEVSEVRRGQRFAFVMDTRLCENVYALAEEADLLVIESTYLDEQADLAAAYGHLTAGQAARVAAECGVRRLVLTHFSQRFQRRSRSGSSKHSDDPAVFATEAAAQFGGDVVVARDLDRIPVPARR